MTDKPAATSDPTSAAYGQCQRCHQPIAGSFVVRGLLYYHVECSISDADRLTVANAEIARLAAQVQQQAAEIEKKAAEFELLTKIKEHIKAEAVDLSNEVDEQSSRIAELERALVMVMDWDEERDYGGFAKGASQFIDEQIAAARAAMAGNGKEEK